MGYISLPSNFNAILGITSYYCVILQVVILHDAIKTIQNVYFVVFSKRTKTCFFKKKRKNGFKKNKKKLCTPLLVSGQKIEEHVVTDLL